jgi:SAM-dependent methyltransferase
MSKSSTADGELKKKALKYYGENSQLYTERYLVPASGDVLWPRHCAILNMLASMNLTQSSKILDLGCGPGLLSCDLAKLGYSGFGLDGSVGMIQTCLRGRPPAGDSGTWKYCVGDVEALPFPDRSFDVVICAGVIEYLPADENLILEVKRVLRPQGQFLLCVTNMYGYTICLSSLFQALKSVPGFMRFASFVRTKFVGGKRGAMAFDFVPRKHKPSIIRRTLAKHQFKLQADRFLQFTVLPAPFCTIMKMGIDKKLGILDDTRLRVLGSSYLLHTQL